MEEQPASTEKTARETEFLFLRVMRKIQNISHPLGSHLWGLLWDSYGGLQEEWFLLEWHFVPQGSDAHLCNCRFHSHRQWIQHEHWGSCFCTEPAGPLGKQHSLGQKQPRVYPLQLLPPSREWFMVSSTLRPLPTYRVVAPLLWQHDIQRWLSVLDIVELGGTWWADHSIRAQHDILCPFKGSFHSKGKLLLWKNIKKAAHRTKHIRKSIWLNWEIVLSWLKVECRYHSCRVWTTTLSNGKHAERSASSKGKKAKLRLFS